MTAFLCPQDAGQSKHENEHKETFGVGARTSLSSCLIVPGSQTVMPKSLAACPGSLVQTPAYLGEGRGIEYAGNQ